MSETDDELARRAKRLLDESAAGLDQRTVLRLRIAREGAFAGRARPRRSAARLWVAAVPAVAATAALAFLLMRGAGDGVPTVRHDLEDLEDLDLVASTEHLELYEDADFYAWLDDQEPLG